MLYLQVFQFQKKEIASKEEITNVGASVAASPEIKEKEGGKIKIESKPLSFLQDTLNSLRGEISNLQLQVDEHTCAVQSSSQAWKYVQSGHVNDFGSWASGIMVIYGFVGSFGF